MTYEEISDYVRFEHRQSEVRYVGSYESEPYSSWLGRDEQGEDIIDEVTCTVSVHLLGDDDHGYILITHDDADGPSDGLGRNVYLTASAALTAMQETADILPAGAELLAA